MYSTKSTEPKIVVIVYSEQVTWTWWLLQRFWNSNVCDGDNLKAFPLPKGTHVIVIGVDCRDRVYFRDRYNLSIIFDFDPCPFCASLFISGSKRGVGHKCQFKSC